MPESFDFNRFFALVRSGARDAFSSVRAQLPGERIYGYGLCSDDDAMTLYGIANSESALREALAANAEAVRKYADQADYFRFCLNEWRHSAESKGLQQANQMLQDRFDQVKQKSDLAWVAFRNQVFDTCILALESLVNEGFFGSAEERKNMFVHFALPDATFDALLTESARRLNPRDLAERYRRFLVG
jgi:hypothetical protein